MKRVATPSDDTEQPLFLKQARTTDGPGNGSASEPEVSNGASFPMQLSTPHRAFSNFPPTANSLPRPLAVFTVPLPPRPLAVFTVPLPPRPLAVFTVPLPPRPLTIFTVPLPPRPLAIFTVQLPPRRLTIFTVPLPPRPLAFFTVPLPPRQLTIFTVPLPPRRLTIFTVPLPPRGLTIFIGPLPPRPLAEVGHALIRMPRIYQRKTGRASWSDSDLRAALDAVRTTGISVRQAGRTWGISHPVLLRHLHGRVHKPGSKTLGYSRTILTPEAEEALKRRIHGEMERRGTQEIGFSMLELRRFVFNDCERHSVPHHFSTGLAGQDWAAGFVRRHPDIPIRRSARSSAPVLMKELEPREEPDQTAAMKAEENAQGSGDNGAGEDDDDGLKITDTETFNTDRYKAFTMLVRHCVDCNLDRMTPISQQPRHKIEEIARACTRQFPEFSEQLCRSRIRSYLKSSRRNGKKHGGVICEKKRSLPSTLTSPAAERLFEQALKLELENQERIAKGLEPIQAPLPSSVTAPIIPLSTLNPEPEPGSDDPPSLTICGKKEEKGELPDPVQVQLLSLLMPQLLSCAAGVAGQSGVGNGTGGVAGMQNFVRECRSVSTFLFAVAEFWEAMLKAPATGNNPTVTSTCATSSTNTATP